MDTENKPQKKKFRHPDRIPLSPESLERLNSWLGQVTEKVKGLKLKRADLLNYLVKSANEKLTTSQIKEIEKEYFDEVKFQEWVLREMKDAKNRGEHKTYAEIINNHNGKSEVKEKKQRKKPDDLSLTDIKKLDLVDYPDSKETPAF